jgi:hypothetical protein
MEFCGDETEICGAVDVTASGMAHRFKPAADNYQTGFLQLVPGADTGFDGHTLGYLLWGLVDTGRPEARAVHDALVNGPTADCWGSFAEAYSKEGVPNDHDLRTFETGGNISAIAKYWGLGKAR